MAEGFEGLVNDAFVRLVFIELAAEQKSQILDEFAGKYPLIIYIGIKADYRGLSLTPLEQLLSAFKTISRREFVHPFLGQFANSDLPIPVWHSPGLGAKAEEALAAIQRVLEEKGSIMPKDYENIYERALSGDGIKWVNTSQPALILEMLALANLRIDSTVLEVGSGCGYLIAIASRIAGEGKVYGLENIPPLVKFSQEKSRQFGNVRIYEGNALNELSNGLPQGADFDAIIFSAGTPAEVAPKFAARLKTEGRLVIPIQCGTPEEMARGDCVLTVYIRTETGYDVISPEKPNTIFTPLQR